MIPVHNEETVIGEQLRALSRQDFRRCWEVVVGDNGSTDRSRAVVEGWRDRLPSLTVVDASARPGVNPTRNTAVRQARGELLLFADGNDVVSPSWVSAMVAVLARADLATGPVELFDDRALELGVMSPHGPLTALGFLPYAIGSNLGVRRPVFDLVGGFDEDWPVHGGDDVNFCWRAQLAGAELGFSEDIRIRYRQPPTHRQAFRKHFGYGIGTAMLSRRYAPLGARRSSAQALRDGATLLRDLPWLLTEEGRIAWVKRVGSVAGLLRGSIPYGDDAGRG